MFCRSTFRSPARFGLGCFGCDQVVGLANEGFEFIRGQHVGVVEHYPLVASDIGRGGDAFDLQQFVECFRRAFESEAREPAVREDHAGEDFAADFEAEVVAPRHVLGYVGEGEAEFADPFHVGHLGDDSATAILENGLLLFATFVPAVERSTTPEAKIRPTRTDGPQEFQRRPLARLILT
jgi:hypothetical protein